MHTSSVAITFLGVEKSANTVEKDSAYDIGAGICVLYATMKVIASQPTADTFSPIFR